MTTSLKYTFLPPSCVCGCVWVYLLERKRVSVSGCRDGCVCVCVPRVCVLARECVSKRVPCVCMYHMGWWVCVCHVCVFVCVCVRAYVCVCADVYVGLCYISPLCLCGLSLRSPWHLDNKGHIWKSKYTRTPMLMRSYIYIHYSETGEQINLVAFYYVSRLHFTFYWLLSRFKKPLKWNFAINLMNKMYEWN